MRQLLTTKTSKKNMMEGSNEADHGGRKRGSMRSLFAETGGKGASSMRNLIPQSKRNLINAEIEAAFNDDSTEQDYLRRSSHQRDDLKRINASVGNLSQISEERPTTLLTKLRGETQSTSALNRSPFGDKSNVNDVLSRRKPRHAIEKHTDELDVLMRKELPHHSKKELQTDLKKGKFYSPPATLPEGLELPPELY